jgi:hypothetical protein
VVVVINKIDREAARPDWVIDATFELFMDLGASDEQVGGWGRGGGGGGAAQAAGRQGRAPGDSSTVSMGRIDTEFLRGVLFSEQGLQLRGQT